MMLHSGTPLAYAGRKMSAHETVPIVRCRLDGPEDSAADLVRFIPVAEFGLWRFLMEAKHRRQVSVDAVSVWMAEDLALVKSGVQAEDLEPVLRVRFEQAGPGGLPIPVERFFPAETYPRALEALLSHLGGQPSLMAPLATPGYFVPSRPPSQDAASVA
jgi:hypothetical protein